MRYTGFPFLTRIRSLIYRESGFPFSVSSIAFLSGLRISVSPISTASTRLSYNRLISALVLIPLSDTKTTSSGARFRSRMLLFISTRNVRRSRLLTPTIFAPASMPALLPAHHVLPPAHPAPDFLPAAGTLSAVHHRGSHRSEAPLTHQKLSPDRSYTHLP